MWRRRRIIFEIIILNEKSLAICEKSKNYYQKFHFFHHYPTNISKKVMRKFQVDRFSSFITDNENNLSRKRHLQFWKLFTLVKK